MGHAEDGPGRAPIPGPFPDIGDGTNNDVDTNPI